MMHSKSMHDQGAKYSDVSGQECLDYCLELGDRCRGAQYSSVYRQCDIFDSVLVYGRQPSVPASALATRQIEDAEPMRRRSRRTRRQAAAYRPLYSGYGTGFMRTRNVRFTYRNRPLRLASELNV